MLRAATADARTARLLEIPAGSPLLVVSETVLDQGGPPLEFSRLANRGDRWGYRTTQLSPEGGGAGPRGDEGSLCSPLMGFDLAVATPTFLDLTFIGLESMPTLGDERYASDLLRSPGGGAITAIGAARLGLSWGWRRRWPRMSAGDLVAEVLTLEGVAIVDRRAPRSPTTVVMPARATGRW